MPSYHITFDMVAILEAAMAGRELELTRAQRAVLRALVCAMMTDYLEWHEAVWA